MAVSITLIEQFAAKIFTEGNTFLKIFGLTHALSRIAGSPIVCTPLEQHSDNMKQWNIRSWSSTLIRM